MPLLIDTSVVPASSRAEYWQSSSCESYHPLQIATDASDRFSGRMWGDQLGAIQLHRIAAAANTMSRTASDIAAGDPECLQLLVLLRGRLSGAQLHHAAALSPGDMTARDTSQPAIFRADRPFDLLVLRIPKAALGKQAASISRLTAIRIPGEAGIPRLAARFFCDTATGLADGSISSGDCGLAGHVVDLVRRLYVDLGLVAQPTRPRATVELLLQAQAHIETSLGDPSLNPEQVARACFISTRYLHRVFESEGLRVCDFIRSARLERCCRDLTDPAFAHQPIQEIAARWGLPNAPHFSRVFREAYGCSPREYRQRAVAGVDDGPTPSGTTVLRKSGRLDRAQAWARAGWKP
jgi:AraC-like DNA-binding protein